MTDILSRVVSAKKWLKDRILPKIKGKFKVMSAMKKFKVIVMLNMRVLEGENNK